MRHVSIAVLLLLMSAACAVRLGGPSPEPYRVVAVPARAADSATTVAESIRGEGGQLALIAADRDSAWFADVASQTGLELSGPGTTGPRGLAFLSGLRILGDTSIVLLVPSGGRIHMHDALFEVAENRNIDLMLVDVVGMSDVRDAVRTLLSYIASDVGNSVPLVMGIAAPTTAAEDSVVALLRAAFANAGDCAADSAVIDVPGLRLLYGPPARMQCDEAKALPGDAGISARLVVGR